MFVNTFTKTLCYNVRLRKPVLSTQNIPIHIMVSIFFCVCYTKSVSFIEFLRKLYMMKVVGVIGHAMRLVDNHTHFRAIQEYVHLAVKIALGFAPHAIMYLTVTGTSMMSICVCLL